MSLPPLDSVPLILRPQAWLHRRHYGQVLSPIRWWGRIPWLFYLVSLFVGYIERRRSPLDPVLRSLVSARIAQLCHCEFCIDITSMTLAARSGSQDKLLAVADWRSSTLFSEKERLALAYAEAATQTPPAVDDALRMRMGQRPGDAAADRHDGGHRQQMLRCQVLAQVLPGQPPFADAPSSSSARRRCSSASGGR